MPNKSKPLVVAIAKRSEEAKLGKDLLKGTRQALVKYRRREWLINELLEHLAHKVAELERTRCVPRAKCLFQYYDYIDRVVERTAKKLLNDTSKV